ncbi:hydrolase [Amycolatopsis taiwanensis]|uniref:Hydrolase n=2 Tax=Amycolatopsis taiwanensis TaxID=342230 RepID=A0A9W6R366_9PSEU|nr:hydrolase [Amycolatopsis taiwanensis]
MRQGAAVRGLIAGGLSAVMMVGTCGTSAAVPPPPSNPSDAQLNAGRAAADTKAGEVGRLANRLAEAEARLSDLDSEVELKQEQANKAMVDLQAAQDAAAQAEDAAAAARREADAATGRVELARHDLDRFIAASYQQGSQVGSVSAYLGSPSPRDLLARQQLLTSITSGQLTALHRMQQAQVDKANADAAARAALQTAQQKRSAAARAQRDADAARAAAEQARTDQAARTAVLTADKDRAEQQLFTAQQQVAGLSGQRQRYEDWLARKQLEDDTAAGHVALTSGGSRPASSAIERVIARAMSQVGVPYAWGGGNAGGPTLGIRDGGVADTFGDYRKVGFDCSGLMMYAFAGVASLPHYSGYQYTAGRHVPLAQMSRGDMLFWGQQGDIYHVALYLGDGMMVEAPESGLSVRVTPVRYGDIMPNATRLLG